MERSSGRYNSYNRRSGGHPSSGQSLSNNNNNPQHLDNHHHHHHHHQPSSHHHHRNSLTSGSGAPSLPLTSTSNAISSSHHSMHTNNASIIATTPTTMSVPTTAAYGREPLTQHDELIRYIKEAWTKVSEHGTPVVYRNDSDQQLKNFKPFNLEEYWGQRLVQNIHVSHGHQ